MEERKSLIRNQEGFTLIEIIAVLVLLGILAAVAVPKYFDLQADAKKKAISSAVAEGMAQVNQAYAQEMLKAGGLPTQTAVLDALAAVASGARTVVSGDFTITFAASGTTGITVSANYTLAADQVDAAAVTAAQKTITLTFKTA